MDEFEISYVFARFDPFKYSHHDHGATTPIKKGLKETASAGLVEMWVNWIGTYHFSKLNYCRLSRDCGLLKVSDFFVFTHPTPEPSYLCHPRHYRSRFC